MKSTNRKRTLLVSSAVILLCMTIIVGMTFALFTDTQKVSNHLQAGDLSITLKRTELTKTTLNATGKLVTSDPDTTVVNFSNPTDENVFGIVEGEKIVPGTKYLGSVKQVGYVQNILDTMGTDDCVRIVDPAMADNGKLYSIFNDEYVAAMRGLCKSADILIPNITEACFLADVEYRETYDESYIKELLAKLATLGAKTIVLTGVGYAPEKTGVIVYENGAIRYYEHDKVSKGCHGTGDIYASAFTGALMNDKDIFEAAKIAADYTVKCIINTQGDADHWYGAKFETALRDLMDMLV